MAESTAPGVKPIAHDTSLDQRNAPTAQWLMRTHEVLVQDDCAVDEPPAPPALLEVYGVKAQMLAPVIREGALVGWISVHEVRSVRTWSAEEVSQLASAASRVAEMLAAGLTAAPGMR